jgi:hypothetical protein
MTAVLKASYERPFMAYSVEKLEYFVGSKIIFDMRNFKT